MVVVVTRDVADRFRGFLASCMLEIAPGVYTAPHMSVAVRERVWAVLTDWHRELKDGSVIMTWKDRNAPGGQAILTLGWPRKFIAIADGVHLVKRVLTPEEVESLKKAIQSGSSESGSPDSPKAG